MRKLFINGYDIKLTGGERMATSYQASPVGEPPAAQGFYSVEFTLPYTNNNRKALGLPTDLPNSSVTPFSLLPAQYEVDGVDMKIDSCQVVSGSKDGINVRLMGGMTSLINAISGKSIRDVDLTSYDHVRNHAAIAAALQTTDGYIYSIINHLDDFVTDNVAMESMYPSFYLHTLIDEMLGDVGYTLSGDLVTNTDYLSVLIPFASKQGEYSTDFINALKSNVYLEQSWLYGGGVTGVTILPLYGETNDPFNLVWNDPFPKYHALIRANYEVNVHAQITALPDTSVTLYLFKQSEYTYIDIPTIGTGTVSVATTGGVSIVDSWTVTGGGTLDETINVGLFKGEKIYLGFVKPSTDEITFVGGASNTFLEITDVTDYGIFYGDTWQIAPNLPNIKQTDLLKWVITTFGCIAELDNDNKVLRLTQFKNVVNNISRDNWSAKLDLNTPVRIVYPEGMAQTNIFKYKDDDAIPKPEGSDYSFAIENKLLPSEAVFYEAPFSATITGEEFTDVQNVCIIDILGTTLLPRVLISQDVTLSTGINLQLAGVTQSTQINVNIPYFINPSASFNLGFATNVIPKYNTHRLNILKRPRQLVAAFNLTPSDINQLDFRKPVWLSQYNGLFYKVRINQYEAGIPTQVELIEIDG